MATWICVLLVAAVPSSRSAAPAAGSGSPEQVQTGTSADAAPTPSVGSDNASDGASDGAVSNAADKTSAPLGPRQLRAAVHEAMIQCAKPGPERASAVRRLADLHGQIVADTQMLDEDRDALERSVRARLKKIGDEITQASRKRTTPPKPVAATVATKPAAAKPAANKPAAGKTVASKTVASKTVATKPAAPKPILAPPAAGNSALGGAAQDEGAALVDLIEQTIAPQTWERNGGLGTIRYFAHGHSIVVRQTDQNHEELGGLIQALGK